MERTVTELAAAAAGRVEAAVEPPEALDRGRNDAFDRGFLLEIGGEPGGDGSTGPPVEPAGEVRAARIRSER